MTISVFISYSSKDLHHVDRIKESIESPEVRVFVAEYSIKAGESIKENISKAIHECNIFILVWSKYAKESGWVPPEYGIAHGLGKLIIPVVLDDSLPLPGFLSDIKYISAKDSMNYGIEKLQDVVQHYIDNVKITRGSANVSKFGLKEAFVLAGIICIIIALTKE